MEICEYCGCEKTTDQWERNDWYCPECGEPMDIEPVWDGEVRFS